MSEASETHSLTIGIAPAVTTGSIYLAQEEGIFAKNHLNVTLKILNGGAATVPALEAGAINMAQSNVLSVIQSGIAGIDEPCFAGAFNQGQIQGLISGAKSGITKLSQLAGKTIAVNALDGVNQLIADAYLKANGVSTANVHYVALGFPDMTAALSSGSVDAVLGVEPFDSGMLQAGDHLLSDTPELSIPSNPIFSCWNSSPSWLKSNQSTVQEFLTSMEETNALIAAHPSDLVHALEANKVASDSVLAASAMPEFTATMTASDVTEWEAVAKQYGIITSTPPVSEVYDPAKA